MKRVIELSRDLAIGAALGSIWTIVGRIEWGEEIGLLNAELVGGGIALAIVIGAGVIGHFVRKRHSNKATVALEQRLKGIPGVEQLICTPDGEGYRFTIIADRLNAKQMERLGSLTVTWDLQCPGVARDWDLVERRGRPLEDYRPIYPNERVISLSSECP